MEYNKLILEAVKYSCSKGIKRDDECQLRTPSLGCIGCVHFHKVNEEQVCNNDFNKYMYEYVFTICSDIRSQYKDAKLLINGYKPIYWPIEFRLGLFIFICDKIQEDWVRMLNGLRSLGIELFELSYNGLLFPKEFLDSLLK